MREKPVRTGKLKLAAILCVFPLLTGCSPMAGVESLLQSPGLGKEQQQIYRALQNAVGSDITLQYPHAGNYLSAFTVEDFDGDGSEEALVFYRKTGVTTSENGLRYTVLDQVDGSWQSVYESGADGVELERVEVSVLGDSETKLLCIGYSETDTTEKMLSVYQYQDNALRQLTSCPYTMFDVHDMDADEKTELLVLQKADDEDEAEATVYTMDGTDMATLASKSLLCGFRDYSQVLYGTLPDGNTGVYIDGATSSSQIQTEVLEISKGVAKDVLDSEEKLKKTARSTGYASKDYNSDGVIEIPVTGNFPGVVEAQTDQVRMTTWYRLTEDSLMETDRSYYSISDGCLFLLPEDWYDVVTAQTDALTGDVVFFKIEGGTEQMRLHVSREDSDVPDEAYVLLHTKGSIRYYVLTNDETFRYDLLTRFLWE